MENWESLVRGSVRERYEVYSYNNAAEILAQAYPAEYAEVMDALDAFSISVSDLMAPGGNESSIPKKFSEILRPRNWLEAKIKGDLTVKVVFRRHNGDAQHEETTVIENFIDGHNIDYVKGEVALDLEWNSKDQTFDRDLYALRAYYEYGIIGCGIVITRSESLNEVFSRLGIKQKYGASTTWMGKLLPRIRSRRHGGCPLLVVGITPKTISDLES